MTDWDQERAYAEARAAQNERLEEVSPENQPLLDALTALPERMSEEEISRFTLAVLAMYGLSGADARDLLHVVADSAVRVEAAIKTQETVRRLQRQ